MESLKQSTSTHASSAGRHLLVTFVMGACIQVTSKLDNDDDELSSEADWNVGLLTFCANSKFKLKNKHERPTLFVHGRGWVPYDADRQSVVVIGPGAGTTQNSRIYEELHADGYKLALVNAGSFDQYPPGWEDGTPDASFNSGQNLAALADGGLQSAIVDLIKKGCGPSVVIAGSRGGQVTVPRMWQGVWRGPTIVLNAGCAGISAVPPAPVRLVLASFGKDYFGTCDPDWTRQVLTKEDSRRPVLLHHDPEDDHTGTRLSGALVPLLELAQLGFADYQEGPWQENVLVELL